MQNGFDAKTSSFVKAVIKKIKKKSSVRELIALGRQLMTSQRFMLTFIYPKYLFKRAERDAFILHNYRANDFILSSRDLELEVASYGWGTERKATKFRHECLIK